MNYIGIQSLITLLSHVIFVFFSFQIVQIIRLDYLIKKGHPQQLKILYLLIAITLGYSASSFFLDFITHAQNLLLFLK